MLHQSEPGYTHQCNGMNNYDYQVCCSAYNYATITALFRSLSFSSLRCNPISPRKQPNTFVDPILLTHNPISTKKTTNIFVDDILLKNRPSSSRPKESNRQSSRKEINPITEGWGRRGLRGRGCVDGIYSFTQYPSSPSPSSLCLSSFSLSHPFPRPSFLRVPSPKRDD